MHLQNVLPVACVACLQRTFKSQARPIPTSGSGMLLLSVNSSSDYKVYFNQNLTYPKPDPKSPYPKCLTWILDAFCSSWSQRHGRLNSLSGCLSWL